MSKLAQASEPTLPFEPTEPVAAEFFAGIGLARLGLQQAGFRVSWSNDIEPAKRNMYVQHFTEDTEDTHKFVLEDIAEVHADSLPTGRLALAWASSPCVDVSLAGARLGLSGTRSAAFYQFTRILRELPLDQRPPVVTLENVVGLATSHNGADLKAAIKELNKLGYSVDVLTLDARWFVPQSRPRLFVVGALNPPKDTPDANPLLRPEWLQGPFRDKSLDTHRYLLPDIEPSPDISLSQVVERLDGSDSRWWDPIRVASFENQLSPIQSERLEKLRKARKTTHRTAYRRTRQGKPQWEIRSDDIAGCLRTARGGSSKQAVVEVGKGELKVRWMTGIEYARLMGAGDYMIDGHRDGHLIFGFGDAVCVPAVAWLGKHYLMPLTQLASENADTRLAAVGA
ncbi:DNA (cytosine-5)-methyltransferase 1 [Saccharothrix ecbatanensis]|uniref:DNA (cytosine-5-)-methyltransferase n=1 Tax=Saccharothrix ecbatanensis TaxID=1105145 RepID=A0A7W9HS80_9PSEU|nr:DNA cytosine methyltransferase [Saccharothrix ecbatanensis]MBB5807305.1 DNA (cytosine-5)-methyltransferase 1 [Saccharothrix ecbatanensis]